MRELLTDIEKYYTAKLNQFGANPRGVDWRDEASQQLRFAQLLKVIDRGSGFSLNDLGCGFGSLFSFMQPVFQDFSYFGYDLSPAMIDSARAQYGSEVAATFAVIGEDDVLPPADFTVASGIFNVKMNYSEGEWLAYILKTLEKMRAASRHGFAFNILTKYSDQDHMRPDLYYADPGFLFDFCKRNFSRNVALLHDYELYEFTMLIRLNPEKSL